jgi:predicted phosphoribosyltransferase
MERWAPFRNRLQAGKQLAEHLRGHADIADAVLLALPRGGIPVGYAMSAELGIPLDIIVVRKLGVPRHEEYAMGAVARGGVRVLQQEVLDKAGIPASAVDAAVRRELQEVDRREHLYRAGRPALPLEGKTAILVDDGLATGSTMQAAVRAVRLQHPRRVIIAVPVGAADSCAKLATEADEVVCLHTPSPFLAVSVWYEEFEQLGDEEACSMLTHAWEEAH